MQKTARRWKSVDDLYAIQHSVLLCLILSMLFAILYPAFGQQNLGGIANGNAAVPQSIHWTDTRMLYAEQGASQTLKTEGWFLGSNHVRLENDTLLLIQKGDKHLCYSREKRTYTEWDDTKEYEQYMPVSLNPDQFLQPWRWAGVDATKSERPVDAQFSYHGQPCCGNIEYAIPPVTFNGGQQPCYGRSSLHAYRSKDYPDCMLAYEFRHWDVTGTRLVESEDVEFTYDKNIPENMFDVTPPTGAVRDDHLLPPTWTRDLHSLHAMHYLGVTQFPATPEVKPRMYQCWYRDPGSVSH